MDKLASRNNKILIFFKTALKITMQELALHVESSHLLLCSIDGCPFCYCFGFLSNNSSIASLQYTTTSPTDQDEEDPNRITHKSSKYRKNTYFETWHKYISNTCPRFENVHGFLAHDIPKAQWYENFPVLLFTAPRPFPLSPFFLLVSHIFCVVRATPPTLLICGPMSLFTTPNMV